MNKNEEGYLKGEVCNRDGCKGVIEEGYKEGGCSCHINPPCSYCTTPSEYCPECGWDAYEEQSELWNAQLKNIPQKTYVYKTTEELFDELKDGEFGYVKRDKGGSVVEVKGKHPNMGRYDIYKKLGLSECPNMPRMKVFNEKTFLLTYFCD